MESYRSIRPSFRGDLVRLRSVWDRVLSVPMGRAYASVADGRVDHCVGDRVFTSNRTLVGDLVGRPVNITR